MKSVMQVASKHRGQLEAMLRRDIPPSSLNETTLHCRIDDLYLPMVQWISEVVASVKEKTPASCVCIGLSGVQGSGKTTVCRYLEEVMVDDGYKCAVVSLDDAYLTRKEQIQVAEENASNPLLQVRGNPGTHDMSLLTDFVQKCKSGSTSTLSVPRYDKSMHHGRGDRVPSTEWPVKQGPLDVVLVEGWCMGFQAVDESALSTPNLLPVNTALRQFEELYKELDAMTVLKIADPQWVYKWREEQEEQLRASGKSAMTHEQVVDFVDRYMPSYETYLSGLYAPLGDKKSSALERIPRLVLEIDDSRLPLSKQPKEFNFSSKTLQGNGTS